MEDLKSGSIYAIQRKSPPPFPQTQDRRLRFPPTRSRSGIPAPRASPNTCPSCGKCSTRPKSCSISSQLSHHTRHAADSHFIRWVRVRLYMKAPWSESMKMAINSKFGGAPASCRLSSASCLTLFLLHHESSSHPPTAANPSAFMIICLSLWCSVTRFSRDFRHGVFSHCERGKSNFPRGIGRGAAVPSRSNPA